MVEDSCEGCPALVPPDEEAWMPEAARQARKTNRG